MEKNQELGYDKAGPFLMLMIGDWKQFGRNRLVCGIIILKRSDVRLAKSLENRGVKIDFYPAKGVRTIDFHNTPVSVIVDVLPMKCIRRIEYSHGIKLNGVVMRKTLTKKKA